jgi:transcriptional regulator with XRE-family HTH domain
MTNSPNFEQLIVSLRLGQNEFARAIGISSNSVSKIVRGLSEPSPKTLRKICEVFPQVNYQWLTTGEGPILLEQPNVQPLKETATTDSAILAELRELRKEFSNLLNVISSQQEMIRKHTGSRTKARGIIPGLLDMVAPSVALRLSV